MMLNSLGPIMNLIHAQLCYQLFITPLHLPIEKRYRDFAKMACEHFEGKRSEVIHKELPRHHVIHRFCQENNPDAKKILIAHGWMSRSAYMVYLIKALHEQGFDVYALDFPAHGESKGLQLHWTEAVSTLKKTLDEQGPFHGVVGHSFGGSMLFSALNIAGQLPEWELAHYPKKAVLIASPTQFHHPIKELAKRFKLNSQGCLQLRQLIRKQTEIDLKFIGLRQFVSQELDIPFLCIHGEQDPTVHPKESIVFCNEYKNATLALLPDADHINVLRDERVDQLVCDFLK